MTDPTQAQRDLQYVRLALARRDKTYHVPPGIAMLWAAYVLVGYTLLDFDPKVGGMFLLVAGIIGGIASSFIGRAHALREGEMDRAEGLKHMLHWGSIFIAVIAIIALSLTRKLDGQTMGQFIALVVGVVYFLGGVHFDRNFLWLGALLIAGAIGVSFLPAYPWTILGVIIAAGLVIPLFFRRSENPTTNATPDATLHG